MPCASMFQHGLHHLPDPCRLQQRDTVKTTEGDEVQRFRLLKPLQTAGHGPILVPYRPLIAKGAMNGAQIHSLTRQLRGS